MAPTMGRLRSLALFLLATACVAGCDERPKRAKRKFDYGHFVFDEAPKASAEEVEVEEPEQGAVRRLLVCPAVYVLEVVEHLVPADRRVEVLFDVAGGEAGEVILGLAALPGGRRRVRDAHRASSRRGTGIPRTLARGPESRAPARHERTNAGPCVNYGLRGRDY